MDSQQTENIIWRIRNRDECSNTIDITVSTFTGEQVPMRMRSNDVIYLVKLIFGELEKIPVNRQRLVFQGRQLDDDKSLADCGIVSGSMVYLVLRLT